MVRGIAFGACALALVSLAACDGTPLLVLQVRTDLAPGVAFSGVQVRLEGEGTPRLWLREAEGADDWGGGVRALEESLPAGRHRFVVSAVEPSGAVVVERPL